jgi:hypothetical protein
MARLARSTVVLLAVLGCPVGQAAAQAPPPSLMGETLTGSGTTSYTCDVSSGPGHGTFDVSGTAAGPYLGTFTATGTFEVTPTLKVNVQEDFTITSGGTEITGTKTGTSLAPSGFIICNVAAPDSAGLAILTQLPTYAATIRPATGGVWRDTGRANMTIAANTCPSGGAPANGLLQNFTQSDGLVQVGPASKDDCKNGGYQQFGYRNQGQCIKGVNAEQHES